MIFIKTNEDNHNYLELELKEVANNLLYATNVNNEIKEIVHDMYAKLFTYEQETNLGYISKVNIPKNSKLAKYLLTTQDIEVINMDNRISYNDIVNAYNIAVFEDNPIQKEILPLFKNRISGEYLELAKIYNNGLLDYILNNSNFKKYIDKNDGIYVPESYVVFEEEKYNRYRLKEEQLTKERKI